MYLAKPYKYWTSIAMPFSFFTVSVSLSSFFSFPIHPLSRAHHLHFPSDVLIDEWMGNFHCVTAFTRKTLVIRPHYEIIFIRLVLIRLHWCSLLLHPHLILDIEACWFDVWWDLHDTLVCILQQCPWIKWNAWGRTVSLRLEKDSIRCSLSDILY